MIYDLYSIYVNYVRPRNDQRMTRLTVEQHEYALPDPHWSFSQTLYTMFFVQVKDTIHGFLLVVAN